LPDANSDGSIGLTDVEWLLRHDANVSAPLKDCAFFRILIKNKKVKK